MTRGKRGRGLADSTRRIWDSHGHSPLLVYRKVTAALEDGKILLGMGLSSEGIIITVLGFGGLFGSRLAALEVPQGRPRREFSVGITIAVVVPMRQVGVAFHGLLVIIFRLLNFHALGRRVSIGRAPAPLALRHAANLGTPLVGHWKCWIKMVMPLRL